MEKPLISAIYLAKFDVHSGYELTWFKSNNEQIYSSKNLEFKALPSGLHALSSDTICFVQQKGGFPEVISTVTDLLYGISVFRQNSDDQKMRTDASTGTQSVDRASVKLYSLGVLIDPEHIYSNQQPSSTLPWKPKIYAACWKHRAELGRLLERFMHCNSVDEEHKFYSQFEAYFDQYRYKVIKSLSPDPPNLPNIPSPRAATAATADPYDKMEEPNPQGLNSPPATASIASSLPQHSDHMVYGLLDLFRILGPMLYRIWKLSLLRRKIIFSCSTAAHSMNEDNVLKIEDLCRFLYSTSLISAVPKELKPALQKSGVRNIGHLEFHTPIYNLCVNDISLLKGANDGFLASTTDQIILEKPELYDYCIRLPATKTCEIKPEIIKAVDNSNKLATHRDFETFETVKRIVTKKAEQDRGLPNQSTETLNELGEHDVTPQVTGSSSITSGTSANGNNPPPPPPPSAGQEEGTGAGAGAAADSFFPPYYAALSEGASISEMVWEGLSWWATAGASSQESNEEYRLELAAFEGVNVEDPVDMVLALVGYFQKQTTRLFNMLVEILANNDADEANEHSLEDTSTDTVVIHHPTDSFDDDEETERLLRHGSSDHAVWVRPQDMHEMGLDPYSQADRQFLVELIQIWWGREARVGSACGKLCCWK